MPQEKSPAAAPKEQNKPAGNVSPAQTDPVSYFDSHIQLLVAKIEKVGSVFPTFIFCFGAKIINSD